MRDKKMKKKHCKKVNDVNKRDREKERRRDRETERDKETYT
jgi:hypothetical protein